MADGSSVGNGNRAVALMRSWLPGDIKALFLFSSSGALGSLIGIVSGPLILQKAGIAHFGFLGLAIFMYGLFNTIADFGIPAHLIASTSDPGNRSDAGIANALAVKAALFLAVVALYAGYALGYPHPAEVKAVAGAYLSVILFSVNHLEWAFISGRRHVELAVGRLCSAIAVVAALAWWYFSGSALWMIPLAIALGQAAELAYLAARLRSRPLGVRLEPISLSRMKAVFTRVAPLASTQILSPFFIANGIFLMDRHLAATEWVGAYSVSQRVIMGWLGLTSPLFLFFIPKLAGRQAGTGLKRILGVSAALSCGLFVAGAVLIKIFYVVSGEQGGYFGYSLGVYAILMAGIFFSFSRLPAVSLLVSRGRYRRYFLIHLLGALPGVALAVAPAGSVPIAAIPWLVCVSELIATVLSLAWAGSLNRGSLNRDPSAA
jgi:O-antigen/teichoic acid export membrane protein